jgi:hypothetical protein
MSEHKPAPSIDNVIDTVIDDDVNDIDTGNVPTHCIMKTAKRRWSIPVRQIRPIVVVKNNFDLKTNEKSRESTI